MLIELMVTCVALAACVDETEGDPKLPDVVVAPVAPAKVEWAELAGTSLRFLGVMHGFRLATEPGTRDGGFGIGRDYFLLWRRIYAEVNGRIWDMDHENGIPDLNPSAARSE